MLSIYAETERRTIRYFFFGFGGRISANTTGILITPAHTQPRALYITGHWRIDQRYNSAIILQVQDYKLSWDKAQSDYKDHKLKAVTWNNIRKSVKLPGMCQIIHAFLNVNRLILEIYKNYNHTCLSHEI